MILEKEFTLSEEEIDYTQFCYFEMDSYQYILGHILLEKTKGYEYSKENYKHFMEEFKLAKFKYFINMQELLKKYCPEYLSSTVHEIEFNFDKHIMSIYHK